MEANRTLDEMRVLQAQEVEYGQVDQRWVSAVVGVDRSEWR